MKCHRCEVDIYGGYCTLCMMEYQDLSVEQARRITELEVALEKWKTLAHFVGEIKRFGNGADLTKEFNECVAAGEQALEISK